MHNLWLDLHNFALKGQCHEIFDFRFFSSISFPQAPEYPIRAVSNFFENSRKNSQLMLANLPPVVATPAVPLGKFTAGVVDTGGKFATGVVDTGCCTLAWGKMIHEKNLKQKIS